MTYEKSNAAVETSLERLIRAVRNLQVCYSRFRDDPSEEDLEAWQELDDAALQASMTQRRSIKIISAKDRAKSVESST